MIDTKWADDNGIGVGDTFDVKTPPAAHAAPTRRPARSPTTADFIGDYAASDVNADAFGERHDVTDVFVALGPGADAEAVQAAIEDALATRFPTAEAAGPRGAQGLDRPTSSTACSARLRAAARCR